MGFGVDSGIPHNFKSLKTTPAEVRFLAAVGKGLHISTTILKDSMRFKFSEKFLQKQDRNSDGKCKMFMWYHENIRFFIAPHDVFRRTPFLQVDSREILRIEAA